MVTSSKWSLITVCKWAFFRFTCCSLGHRKKTELKKKVYTSVEENIYREGKIEDRQKVALIPRRGKT
jgi:hypothetical protein